MTNGEIFGILVFLAMIYVAYQCSKQEAKEAEESWRQRGRGERNAVGERDDC